ncbi:MAG: hypothetical protein JSV76_02665 [Candidatus Bathyarchaeota archaeon]|nr:MAG: hypothetical protein JSV76_02665 [Candidatus Bathyarchaeota archaeon]
MKNPLKYKPVILVFFVVCLTIHLLIVPLNADTLLQEDFQQPSFAKTVDFFDYARAWATLKGLPQPPQHWHANVYMTYINQSGFQLLYAGLREISLIQNLDVTIPMQTVLMHYKTQEANQDALVASSFLMVMGFNDTDTSLYEHSPDKNDNLWASFSLGVDLTELFPNVTFPAFNSDSEVIPLDHPDESADYETWTWGMKYTNLTALWVTTDLVNADETKLSRPFGLATYDELTFKYRLRLYPNGTATLHKDYIIGRMHDLFVFGGWFLIWPIYNHYNSTGCYRYNAKVSDETVYDFLEANEVSMSIVEYQKVILLDRETQTTTAEGTDVIGNEVEVSTTSISTHSEDGELICNQNFGAKPTYDLYNLSETEPTTFDAVVRTYNISGYARNRNLFEFQTSFQRYVPLILVGMYPGLYQRARDTISNMNVTDCLYIISYPSYGGYKIDHDPVFTAYYTPVQAVNPMLENLKGILFLSAIIVPILVGVFLLRRRRQSSIPSFP